ncbi:hypothetical protein [Nocardiopsis metallicus]|uniref:Uncharacterized protein n=1 Tax=Nocardiopsis metallicus TaxID=179819 RepID=A0A840WME0_9ACTN|nr:hypothetical protein [Nocardiopsis metallicus]MBB5491278.1 hypothetical protein [Nocardiopsis metallicus]
MPRHPLKGRVLTLALGGHRGAEFVECRPRPTRVRQEALRRTAARAAEAAVRAALMIELSRQAKG